MSNSSKADTDRHFDEILFCGAGDWPYDIAQLHARVDKALNYLRECQQPPHWMHEPSQDELATDDARSRKAELVCETVVRDVAKALTGRDIQFVPTCQGCNGAEVLENDAPCECTVLVTCE